MSDDSDTADDETEPDDEIELLEREFDGSPAQAATWLRELAETLEAGGELTVYDDDESVTVSLPDEELEFEVELEREPSDDGDELELEIELEWLDPDSVDADD
ncbi:amphi-Trp domain-containing protein [Natronolimnobius baerhuensis]|uniref:Amphi-Trp domain-containing protein n=1 Tax=Natronolimnobius baerhuensis TaxID=253108 RepID=A0A202E920_9EURY|nr:amphi-Trp domain-containing protein [Natronolimnobius baerhuensis]OVE84773.1 amphi-Trp domain-containing protein [Natronolimnobius baerhuensis]